MPFKAVSRGYAGWLLTSRQFLDNNVITIADERASRRKRLGGTMRTAKGKRSRKIPIHPRLREVLLKMKREADGRVFHAERGGQIRPPNVLSVFIRDVIDKLKAKFPTPEGEIGFEHGRLHSFHHFFVSQCFLFLGGASEGEIREWVGRQQDGRALSASRPQGRGGEDGANHICDPSRERAGADRGGNQSCSGILNPATATARAAGEKP